MKAPRDDLAQALAAEYVLGTLRGRARRRFEGWMRSDRALEAIVRQWETGLTPMAARVPPVEPPSRVWRTIESRIGEGRAAKQGLWSNTGFWRALGMMSGGLAAVLVVAFLTLAPAARDPMFVAVLNSPEAQPRLVVTMHSPNELRVRMVQPWKSMEGKDLELWVLAKDGTPRSLGLVPNRMGEMSMPMPAGDPRMKGAMALAVSMEPLGGSPTHQPTGPVLCSGPIAPTRQA